MASYISDYSIGLVASQFIRMGYIYTPKTLVYDVTSNPHPRKCRIA